MEELQQGRTPPSMLYVCARQRVEIDLTKNFLRRLHTCQEIRFWFDEIVNHAGHDFRRCSWRLGVVMDDLQVVSSKVIRIVHCKCL